MDQDAVSRPLDDPGDGRPPAVSVSGRHGDGEAFKLGREDAGVALEAGAPEGVLHPGRGPSGERIRGWILESDCRLVRSSSGTELAIESFLDEGAQPGAEVEVVLGSEAPEALAGLGRDADVEGNRM